MAPRGPTHCSKLNVSLFRHKNKRNRGLGGGEKGLENTMGALISKAVQWPVDMGEAVWKSW